MLRVLRQLESIVVEIDPDKVELPSELKASFGKISIKSSNVELKRNSSLKLYHTHDICLGHGQRPILRSNEDHAKEDYQRVKSAFEQGKYKIKYDDSGKQQVEFTGEYANLKNRK